MRTTIRNAALLAAVCASLAGCDSGDAFPSAIERRLNGDAGDSKLDAKPQKRAQFDVPSMGDEGAPLALSGNDSLAEYEGSLLFWDAEQVTPPQIAAIANSSTESRLKKADFLDLAASTMPGLEAAIPQREADARAIYEDNSKVAANADPAKTREARKEFVDAWLDVRLDLAEAAGALDDATRGEVESQFHRYCEYKLWELATSRLLFQRFGQRPTPLSLCEAYYAQRGYFQVTEAAPECAPASAAGDWFDCVWKQGVLKSAMLEQLAAHVPEGSSCATSGAARVKAIEGWLVPEADGTSLLRKMVADTNKFQNKRLAEMLVEDGYPTLKTLLTASAGRNFRTTFPYATRFANCPEAFAVKGQRGPDAVAAALKLNAKDPAASASPVTIAELKGIGENNAPGQSDESLFASLPGRETQALAVFELVTKPLAAFGARLASGLEDAIPASYDDRLTNWIETGAIPLPATHGGVLAIDVEEDEARENNQRPAFAALFNIRNRLLQRYYPELWTAELAAKEAVEVARADFLAGRDALEPKLQAIEDENLRGASAASSPGATTSFQTMVLKLATTGGKLSASLKVAADGREFKGCSDFEQLVECPEEDEQAPTFRSIAFDGETGKLTLEVQLDDPATQGFAARPRGELGNKFNEIEPGSLRGMTLRLEIYANRLGDVFRFVSGKAFLVDADGSKIHEGSFSADNYGAEKARLRL
jgi:hypothetical protein